MYVLLVSCLGTLRAWKSFGWGWTCLFIMCSRQSWYEYQSELLYALCISVMCSYIYGDMYVRLWHKICLHSNTMVTEQILHIDITRWILSCPFTCSVSLSLLNFFVLVFWLSFMIISSHILNCFSKSFYSKLNALWNIFPVTSKLCNWKCQYKVKNLPYLFIITLVPMIYRCL